MKRYKRLKCEKVKMAISNKKKKIDKRKGNKKYCKALLHLLNEKLSNFKVINLHSIKKITKKN